MRFHSCKLFLEGIESLIGVTDGHRWSLSYAQVNGNGGQVIVISQLIGFAGLIRTGKKGPQTLARDGVDLQVTNLPPVVQKEVSTCGI